MLSDRLRGEEVSCGAFSPFSLYGENLVMSVVSCRERREIDRSLKRESRSENSRLTDSQKELASSYYRYAIDCCRSFCMKYPKHKDEFVSEAGMSTIRAARTYNPSVQLSFATYLKCRVRHDAITLIARLFHPLGYRCPSLAFDMVPRTVSFSDNINNRFYYRSSQEEV